MGLLSYMKNRRKAIENWKEWQCTYLTRFVKFNDNTKEIFCTSLNGRILLTYNDILDCTLIEKNGKDINNKGSLKKAIIGGVIAGETGAIIGGMSGVKSTVKSTCELLQLNIFTNNDIHSVIEIRGVAEKMNISDYRYQRNLLELNRAIVKLKKIINDNNSDTTNEQEKSNIAELLNLKYLLDSGALTQEEFNSEKLKILNR